MELVFLKYRHGVLGGGTGQYTSDALRRKSLRGGIGGKSLHASVSNAVMGVEYACSHLGQLSDVSEKQNLAYFSFGGSLKHEAYEIAGLDNGLSWKAIFHSDAFTDFPRYEYKGIMACCLCHVNLGNQGILEGFLGHGAKDSGGSDN